MQSYLVVDNREQQVLPFVQSHFAAAGRAWTASQIHTGDYLICKKTGGAAQVVACIERKTHKDFASSIMDGRYENKRKMMELRARCGCQLYFFVEGPAFPAPGRKVGRMPFATLVSAMTSLMVRDGIHVVLTQDVGHTVQRLLQFAEAADKCDFPFAHPIDAAPAASGGDPAGDSAGGGDPASAASSASAASAASSASAAVLPPGLTGRYERRQEDICIDLWAALPGVSLVVGKTLYDAWSVADLVQGRVPEARLAALRPPGRRKLPPKALAALRKLAHDDADQALRVLAALPGLSRDSAAQVLAGGRGLRALLGAGEAALAGLQLQQRGRQIRLGPDRAARYWALLHTSAANGPDGSSSSAAAPAAAPAASSPASSPAAAPAAGTSAIGTLVSSSCASLPAARSSAIVALAASIRAFAAARRPVAILADRAVTGPAVAAVATAGGGAATVAAVDDYLSDLGLA